MSANIINRNKMNQVNKAVELYVILSRKAIHYFIIYCRIVLWQGPKFLNSFYVKGAYLGFLVTKMTNWKLKILCYERLKVCEPIFTKHCLSGKSTFEPSVVHSRDIILSRFVITKDVNFQWATETKNCHKFSNIWFVIIETESSIWGIIEQSN